MNGYKITREDAMVLGGGIVLLIGLFAFPWYSVAGFDFVATGSPYAIWGIFALIVLIAILIDLALERFSPNTQIPTTQLGRGLTRVALCALMLLFLFIKFVAHVGDFGWGFYIDVILAIVVTGGCWLIAQGKATPLGIPTSGGTPR